MAGAVKHDHRPAGGPDRQPPTIDATTAIDAAVRAIVGARRSGRPLPAPALPDAAAAYAVQHRVAQALGWFGDGPQKHWKSGAPSPSALQTHAPLPPAGVWASPADARTWPFALRGIEAEIALRIGRDVDAALAANVDAHSAATLIDAMAVSIEIVDSRWLERLQAPALAKLADLQSHGALVLSGWVDFVPCDWSSQRCRVSIGERPPREFIGTHSLGDPTRVLPAWLRHATRDGGVLAAGSVVTTGTWCGIVDAAPGDRVVVDFDGIGSASVQL